ncbi:MmpS family transport accessory protein [Mycolicibacterium sarraceniae]
MNDPRRPGGSDPMQAGGGYSPNPDPAYAGQYYGPGYGTPGYGQGGTQPTEQLPTHWHQGGGEPPTPPPGPPKSPKWLWIAAGVAVLLVVGLVIALVIVSSSARDTMLVAPLPPLSETSSTTPRATTSIPTTTLPPLPTTSGTPGTTTVPGGGTTSPTGTDTVVYNVAGEGRAINITYVDTGGIMQTEFNVMLPWSKEVSLPAPARASASVAVVNVGRDVTCNVSVNGTQVRERTGRGLTICTGAG